MIRKILVTVVVIVVVLGSVYFYLDNRNRTLSPPGLAELTHAGMDVSITYSRPSVRDRLIFGTDEQKALQPYGAYWRLGANEATEITFSQDVLFNGKSLKQGQYRIYAIPGESSFEVIVNSELGEWGYSEPDESNDLISTQAPVSKSTNTEQFTITLEPDSAKINAVFKWSDVRFSIPISPN